MSYAKVEDPSIIEQLNKKSAKKVTDPEILRQLNSLSENNVPQEESLLDKLPRNIVSGLANLGHSTMNMPHDIVQNLEQQGQQFEESINKALPLEKYIGGNKLPGRTKQQIVDEFNKEHNVPEHLKNPLWNKPISERIPHQQDYNFAQMLGQKGEGTLMDRLIQKAVEHSPELLGIGKLLYHAPITKYPAARSLNKVKKEINKRGVGNLNLPEHIIKDIEENKFLRNTQPNRNLLERAKHGAYEDLFDLQSDLEKVGRSHRNDMFNAANRQFGKDIGLTRQELLDSMRQELSNLGHKDLADLIRHGQNQYRQYMKFKPYRNMALASGVASLGIPGFKYIKKLMNP